ncbi:hypothetical protein Q9L58_006224 [Maublancomyces gigas]|uniref:Uncharacterized protein n=1 Tax=Discina gigas TaxID=1032678 RepID=A0ABR3GG13_9PEZI
MTSISCPLERTWHGYFNNKDAGSIKAIQDALNCCGLKTVREQAWPFANKNTPADTCSTTFNRKTPCFGPWSQKHQLSASMFTTLAIVMLMSKVIIFAVYRRRARNQPLAATQRRIGSATRNGSSAENSGSQVAGLRVRPDERTKYTDNDYDDVESVVDEASRLLENNENGTQYEAPRLLEEASGSILPSGDDSIWRNEHSRTHPSRQES